jgi:hypothetical protein
MWFWLMILACLSTINILYRKEFFLIKSQQKFFIRISDWILDLIKPEGVDLGSPQGQKFYGSKSWAFFLEGWRLLLALELVRQNKLVFFCNWIFFGRENFVFGSRFQKILDGFLSESQHLFQHVLLTIFLTS